jgi:hypothetical protein
MIEKHIQILNANPFFCGLIFQSFYNGYEKENCPLFLHYIVLPIILFNDTRQILSEITKKVDFDKFVNENKLVFIDLQTKIWNMKNLTNTTLIYLHNHKKIELKANIEILHNLSYEKYSEDLNNYLRSAYYLGLLLTKEETRQVFKTLNVIP